MALITSLPLFVDLDGTLIKTDLLVESYIHLLKLTRMNLQEILSKKFLSITEQPGWPYSRAWLEDAANQCKAGGVPFLVALHQGEDGKFLADLSLRH
jgi:hypothetical protein